MAEEINSILKNQKEKFKAFKKISFDDYPGAVPTFEWTKFFTYGDGDDEVNEWPKDADLNKVSVMNIPKLKLNNIEWLHDVSHQTYRFRMQLNDEIHKELPLDKGIIGSENEPLVGDIYSTFNFKPGVVFSGIKLWSGTMCDLAGVEFFGWKDESAYIRNDDLT